MSGPGAISVGNSVRAALRGILFASLRERVAMAAAALSAAAFVAGEVVGLSAALGVARTALAELPTLRPEYLVERLLGGAFTAEAVLLVLGSLTTAVSTLFLSEELGARVVLPIAHRRLLTGRLFVTIAASSAPALLLTLPAVGVAAWQSAAPRLAAVSAVAAVLSVVLLSGACGVLLALILVWIVPPRRARLLAAFLSAAGLATALVGFRGARPERLLDPVATLRLLTAIGETAPEPPGLNPLAWASRAAALGLFGHESGLLAGLGLFLFSMLVVVALARLSAPLHFTVWQRTREDASPTRRRPRGRAAGSIRWPLFASEAASLLRDASTPAQVGSLAAVFVLDLLNLRFLPSGDPAARDVVAGLQTGLALFLVSALSLRFAYPAVSLDGRSALVLKSLPLSPGRHLLARYTVRAVPAVLSAVLLVAVSDLVLQPAKGPFLASLLLAVVGGLALPALHLGLGATFPRYGAPSAVAVALGPGGLFALILSICLSALAALCVSDELRSLAAVALKATLARGPLLLGWTVAATVLGLLPLLVARRALETADISLG